MVCIKQFMLVLQDSNNSQRKDYETVQIKENDVIEVVSFVGGG